MKEKKDESPFKVTEEGKKVFYELYLLNELARKNIEGPYGFGVAPAMVEEYVRNLSNDEFNAFVMLPIGNMTRRHYSMMRKRKIEEKEKGNVLLVYLKNEEKWKQKDFIKFLKSEDFNIKLTGPINAPECSWLFVFLDKKEYIIGRLGVDFAGKRRIKHALHIDEFYMIYDIYKKEKTLDDKKIKNLVKKYDGRDIFDFS